MASVVPTEAMPRKSALNGLIGAALGPVDRGHGSARDLEAIGERYTLHVRVERRNAATEDFQVLAALPHAASVVAERSHRVATASVERFPANRDRGNFPTTVSRRDFLAHSEFVVAIESDYDTATAWLTALRNPVFMPYFGRRSCAPTFPFVLGMHRGSVEEVFSRLPHVDLYRQGTNLLGYAVHGDYDRHQAVKHPTPYSPAFVGAREDQLAWVKENLS
jgi:CRISPR-associated protein Cas5/CasD subtype I-E